MKRLELAFSKSTGCAAAVGIDTDQETRAVRVWFKMGKWPAFEKGSHSPASFGGIH
jgi:hypothetical protein